MQYTKSPSSLDPGSPPLAVDLRDLADAFATLPDPRRAQGRVYWLPSLLCLAVAALLCNCRSVLAMAEWAACLDPALRAALGLPADRSPHQSTLHRLFRQLDPDLLSQALSDYFSPAPAPPRRRGTQAIAVDGKAHRGQLQFAPTRTGTIHEISAFCHDTGVVLAQLAVDSQAREAELSAAPTLLSRLNWQGRILTGDALYCQPPLCAQVLAGQGDYVLVVKGNQPELLADVDLLFADPALHSAAAAHSSDFDYRTSRTLDKGHGRIEERCAIASTALADYSNWPGLAQVVQITRTWQQQGTTRQARHYVVTSLPPAEASVGQLLALHRGHWRIENSLHYVKDVTLGEDRSLIHVGAGGAVLAALRSTVVSLLHRAGHTRIAAALRANSQRPAQALRLMGRLVSSDA